MLGTDPSKAPQAIAMYCGNDASNGFIVSDYHREHHEGSHRKDDHTPPTQSSHQHVAGNLHKSAKYFITSRS